MSWSRQIGLQVALATLVGCPRADSGTATLDPAAETERPARRVNVWISIETEPLPAEVGEPIRRALEARECEQLLLALPDRPTPWESVALARCYWRSDRVVLALEAYRDLAGPEHPIYREAVRANLIAHFDHRMPLITSVTDLDALAGEGLVPGVDMFLRVYLDADRCRSSGTPSKVWDDWAAVELEVRDPGLRAAIGTLFVECGDWSTASGRDSESAVRLSTAIWPNRQRIALLPDGHARLVLARASATFGARKLPIRDGIAVAAEHYGEIRDLAELLVQECPRSCSRFPQALDLALALNLAAHAPERAAALLTEIGPSGAVAAPHWTTWLWIAGPPEEPAFADWQASLEASLTTLDVLATIDPNSDPLELPESLRRCIELAECDPALELALGDRAWWIGMIEPSYRRMTELRAAFDAHAHAPAPSSGSEAEFRIAWMDALYYEAASSTATEIRRVVFQRRSNTHRILAEVAPTSTRLPSDDVMIFE